MSGELPPEAYEEEARRATLSVPLRGFFAPPTPGETSGRLLRVNAFRNLDQALASACARLPGVEPGVPFSLQTSKPSNGVWIAGVLELLPEELDGHVIAGGPLWWQGVAGAPAAEAALRKHGRLIGYVVQDAS